MTSEIGNIIKRIKEDKRYLVPLSLYIFLLLFFCSKMSPLYPVNEWADINIYFNMGKAMMNGRTLYAEAFDHKGPLIFFIYGIGYLISNGSFFGMFLIQLALWLMLALAVYYTAKLFLNQTFAAITALLAPYAMLSFTFTGGSAEEFIVIFQAISLCLFIAYFKKGGKQHPASYMFVHGVLSAATLLIKLNLIVFWFFPLLVIFIQLLLNKEYKNFFSNCAAYLGGVALVFAPILIYFIANGALNDAYQVYIELNRQYSSSNDYNWIISNGLNRLTTTFRSNLTWFMMITIGIFYFPFRHIKNRRYQIAIVLSGVSLVGMTFFPLTFHFYYPLILFVFVTLGLIVILDIIQKSITVRSSKTVVYLALAIATIMCIGTRNLYNMGGSTILRKTYPNGPQFQFKEEVLKVENPTLLNIAFGEGNALFTTCNIVPSMKYFMSPNIYYGMYPNIRDEQTKYIENKEVDFIVSSSSGFNYKYFEQLSALSVNYAKIDSVKSGNETYFLYKKR